MRTAIVFLLMFSGSLFAQDWKEFHFSQSGAGASSSLSDPNGDEEDPYNNWRYGAQNILDKNMETAWVEGVEGSGIGEFIFSFVTSNFRTVTIFGGFAKNLALWEQNNRVKRMKLTIHIGINAEGFVTEVADVYQSLQLPGEFFIDLEDVSRMQTFNFPVKEDSLIQFRERAVERFNQEFDVSIKNLNTILRLEIVDIYRGSKYDDTCISELFFSDTFLTDYRTSYHKKVNKVYIDPSNESRILIDTPERNGISIKECIDAVFQISEASPNNDWITVIQMPKEVGEGRIETNYLLLNTRLARVMNAEVEIVAGQPLIGPFILVDRNGATVLEFSDGEIYLR